MEVHYVDLQEHRFYILRLTEIITANMLKGLEDHTEAWTTFVNNFVHVKFRKQLSEAFALENIYTTLTQNNKNSVEIELLRRFAGTEQKTNGYVWQLRPLKIPKVLSQAALSLSGISIHSNWPTKDNSRH